MPKNFLYFLEEIISHGKPQSNIININVFLLPSLQLWRESSAGTPALLSLFIDVRWPQWEVLQPPPFTLKAAGERLTKTDNRF